jgi:hypothetical protein
MSASHVVLKQERRTVTVLHGGSDQRAIVVAVNGAYIPRADVGANTIGGIPVEFSGLQENNVIAYNGQKFVNRAQELLTDGGNF